MTRDVHQQPRFDEMDDEMLARYKAAQEYAIYDFKANIARYQDMIRIAELRAMDAHNEQLRRER